jgi:hypothetical protein
MSTPPRVELGRMIAPGQWAWASTAEYVATASAVVAARGVRTPRSPFGGRGWGDSRGIATAPVPGQPPPAGAPEHARRIWLRRNTMGGR